MRRIPRIRVQYSVYFPTKVRKPTVMAAPRTGPAKVNHPPRRHMMKISRERTQKSRSGKTERSRTTKRTPAMPGEEGADHNGPELMASHVDADGRAPLGIVADRLQGAPEGGFQNQVKEDQGDGQNDQG